LRRTDASPAPHLGYKGASNPKPPADMTIKRLLHWARLVVTWLIVPALIVVVWGEVIRSHMAEDAELLVWDKALHFTAYFGLSLMATIAVRGQRAALWCAMALIAMGAALEIIQGFVGRDCDVWDETANTLGVVTGLVVGWLGVWIVTLGKLVDPPPAE
jgi:VanZ family protein